MCQVAVNIPQEVLYDKCISHVEAEQIARKATALYCYVHKNVSIGYCAEIAGMNEEDFIIFLGQNKISVFRYDDMEEFEEDYNNA